MYRFVASILEGISNRVALGLVVHVKEFVQHGYGGFVMKSGSEFGSFHPVQTMLKNVSSPS